jgi:hypothetical protein
VWLAAVKPQASVESNDLMKYDMVVKRTVLNSDVKGGGYSEKRYVQSSRWTTVRKT